MEYLSEESIVLVCGDFNADVGSGGGPRGPRLPTKRGSLLLDFIIRHDFCVTNLMDSATGPADTFVGPLSSSTLDYILAPSSMTDGVGSCFVKD